MPRFVHVSRYSFPRSDVFAWHERPGAFVRLTPPGMATIIQGPTAGIQTGSTLTIRLTEPVVAGLFALVPTALTGRRNPPGFLWRIRHTDYQPGSVFTDEQVDGPFESWRHEHHFTDGPEGSTMVTDIVDWELPRAVRSLPTTRWVEQRLERLFVFREQQLRDDLTLHARLSAAPRTVVVSGSSGLIGSQVCALLESGGHRVIRLVRRPSTGSGELSWNPVRQELDPANLTGVDAVLNLSGEPLVGRFTPQHRDAILQSRLNATKTLVRAINEARGAGPGVLVQASAIGYYGARRPRELLREDSAPGTDFLAQVVLAWEAAGSEVSAEVRTAFLRTGLVLSAGGGLLVPQLPLFLIGAGGRLTQGDAWFSWISLDDMVRAYVHALLTESCRGPINAVAPNPVTVGEFAAALGRALHRPAMLPTPAFGPRLLLGEQGVDELVNTDQRVSSALLQQSGFTFGQPDINNALAHVLQRGKS